MLGLPIKRLLHINVIFIKDYKDFIKYGKSSNKPPRGGAYLFFSVLEGALKRGGLKERGLIRERGLINKSM